MTNKDKDAYKTISTLDESVIKEVNYHPSFFIWSSINTEENEVILLSEEHVWKLSNFKDDDFFGGDIQQYDIPGKRTQKESICYKNSTTAFLADEKEGKKKGRNLYEFSLK